MKRFLVSFVASFTLVLSYLVATAHFAGAAQAAETKTMTWYMPVGVTLTAEEYRTGHLADGKWRTIWPQTVAAACSPRQVDTYRYGTKVERAQVDRLDDDGLLTLRADGKPEDHAVYKSHVFLPPLAENCAKPEPATQREGGLVDVDCDAHPPVQRYEERTRTRTPYWDENTYRWVLGPWGDWNVRTWTEPVTPGQCPTPTPTPTPTVTPAPTATPRPTPTRTGTVIRPTPSVTPTTSSTQRPVAKPSASPIKTVKPTNEPRRPTMVQTDAYQGELAATGPSDTATLAGFGVGILLLGAGVILASRRGRRH